MNALVAQLRDALELADAALRGANMNMAVVERKVAAALAASGMSACGQDPAEGLEAKPASPTAEGGDAQNPPQSSEPSHDL